MQEFNPLGELAFQAMNQQYDELVSVMMQFDREQVTNESRMKLLSAAIRLNAMVAVMLAQICGIVSDPNAGRPPPDGPTPPGGAPPPGGPARQSIDAE
jgi:hypothetical protein